MNILKMNEIQFSSHNPHYIYHYKQTVTKYTIKKLHKTQNNILLIKLFNNTFNNKKSGYTTVNPTIKVKRQCLIKKIISAN